MPKEKYSSFTVQEHIYQDWFAFFNLNKKELQSIGIGTATNFIVMMMTTVLDNKDVLDLVLKRVAESQLKIFQNLKVYDRKKKQ